MLFGLFLGCSQIGFAITASHPNHVLVNFVGGCSIATLAIVAAKKEFDRLGKRSVPVVLEVRNRGE